MEKKHVSPCLSPNFFFFPRESSYSMPGTMQCDRKIKEAPRLPHRCSRHRKEGVEETQLIDKGLITMYDKFYEVREQDAMMMGGNRTSL